MLGLIWLLLMGLVIAWAAATLYAAWVLTHPPRRTYASAVSRGRPGDPSELDPPRPFETWKFRALGREFDAWDITGDDPAGPLVILSHGWGDSRLGGLVRLSAIAPLASRLILWDMPPQGSAGGACRLGTREHLYLRALIDTLDPSDLPLVLYGWSLGAGVSIVEAAGDSRVGGVMAEAPYRFAITPARNVLHLQRLPHRLNLSPAFWALGALLGVGLGWRGFDRADHAARLVCPLLVIHGENDPICPPEDGRAIAQAAQDAEFVPIPGGSHNDLWTNPELAEHAATSVRTFLTRLRDRSETSAAVASRAVD